MKRFLFLFSLLIVMVSQSEAHPYVPLTGYLPRAETVCLTQVVSIDRDKVVFHVTEILRGKCAPSLVLLPEDGGTYPMKSEWLLVSSGAEGNTVGYAFGGDCGWIPGRVKKIDGKRYVECGAFPNSGINLDAASDGTKGLTLEHVKKLLQKIPSKP